MECSEDDSTQMITHIEKHPESIEVVKKIIMYFYFQFFPIINVREILVILIEIL